jgi:hypothetical protein
LTPSVWTTYELDGDDQHDGQGKLCQPMSTEAVGISPQLTEIAQPRVRAFDGWCDLGFSESE